VDGIRELVADGENGFVFKRGNWKELAGRINQLSTDITLRRNLGEESLARFLKGFGDRRMTEKLFEVVADVLAKGLKAGQGSSEPR
jgi:glycosyltransferase involved in cell wall biosynthesis